MSSRRACALLVLSFLAVGDGLALAAPSPLQPRVASFPALDIRLANLPEESSRSLRPVAVVIEQEARVDANRTAGPADDLWGRRWSKVSVFALNGGYIFEFTEAGYSKSHVGGQIGNTPTVKWASSETCPILSGRLAELTSLAPTSDGATPLAPVIAKSAAEVMASFPPANDNGLLIDGRRAQLVLAPEVTQLPIALNPPSNPIISWINETKLRAQACLKPTLDLALTPESASLPLATHL